MANHLPTWNQEVFLHQSSFLKHRSTNSNWRHYQSPEDVLESSRTPCNLPCKDRMIERWRHFQLSSNTRFLMWVNFLPKTTPRSWLQDCKAEEPTVRKAGAHCELRAVVNWDLKPDTSQFQSCDFQRYFTSLCPSSLFVNSELLGELMRLLL